MTAPVSRFVLGSLAGALAACAAPPPLPVAPTGAFPARWAQIEVDGRPAFARCTPPACPHPTPKTLAPLPPPALPPVPNPTVVPTAPPPARPTLTLHFALGSARLDAAARAQLARALDAIERAQHVIVIGRTDSTGPLAANESLAFARALTVRAHLLRLRPHLAPALTLRAQGGCCFVAANDTPDGRARNRRVELVLDRAAPRP